MNEDVRAQKLPFGEKKKLSSTIVAYVIIAVAIAFVVGFVSGARSESDQASLTGSAGVPADVDLSPLWKAWRVIDEKFVPATIATTSSSTTPALVDKEKRVWGMIAGMAESLDDPYTFFLPPVENKVFEQDMSGAFEGVGMEIAVRNQVLTVVSPLKGTPAERAGIKSGDLVLKIDGADTKGLDISSAVNKIRGPRGSTVTLYMFREGWSEPKDVKVIRDTIDIPTIETELLPDGTFKIQLISFTANSPDLFRGALREFIASGSKKLILDLRGNPGGYLEAAVDMASWFLPQGAIVVKEDYDKHADNIVHRSRGYDVFDDSLRMVILVDKGSASASEILAGALQHWGVATLVGTHTFGKGSVQELVEITKESSLKITVAHWVGPNGTQIPLEGITPDVEIENSEKDIEAGKDLQLEKAVEILRAP